MSLFIKISALLILIAFYVVYFGKSYLLKQKGIKVDNIKFDIDSITDNFFGLILKAGIALASLAGLASIVFSGYINTLPNGIIRLVGLVAALAGLVMFFLSVRELKDNWRVGFADSDNTDLITTGVYSFSRNPAFMGFDLLLVGILIMFYNPVMLLCTAFAALLIEIEIRIEEHHLSDEFGKKYEQYKKEVRRHFGRKNAAK